MIADSDGIILDTYSHIDSMLSITGRGSPVDITPHHIMLALKLCIGLSSLLLFEPYNSSHFLVRNFKLHVSERDGAHGEDRHYLIVFRVISTEKYIDHFR